MNFRSSTAWFFLSCLILFLTEGNIVALSLPFTPPVRNYSVSSYKAGMQNWAIDQDEDGILYVGNAMGLLEFDGTSWILHPLPTKGIIRSVLVGKDGRIYVGAFEEFGYFQRMPDNSLKYVSLSGRLLDYSMHNEEIWTILQRESEVIFHSFGCLFLYRDDKVEAIPLDGLYTPVADIHGTIYFHKGNAGLYKLDSDHLTEVSSPGNLIHDLIKILPLGNGRYVFITPSDGLFVGDFSSLKKFHTDADAIFKSHPVNKAILTQGGDLVLGTISNGILALDKEGHQVWHLNSETKLQNNTVLGLFCDPSGNIWAALDDGISYIQSNLGVYIFEPSQRKIGMVYDVLARNDSSAYIASNQGLYYAKGPNISLIPDLSGQTWFLKDWNGNIICGHNNGTYLIQGKSFRRIPGPGSGLCFKELDLYGSPGFMEGTYANPVIFKTNADGSFAIQPVSGDVHLTQNLVQDHLGNIWAQHLRKGIYRFRLSEDGSSAEHVRRFSKIGNDRVLKYSLFKLKGRVVMTDGDNFYTYADLRDTIVLFQELNDQLSGIKGVTSVCPLKNNEYWFCGSESAYFVKDDGSRLHVIREFPFSMFSSSSYDGRYSFVYNKDTDESYLCMNNAIGLITRRALDSCKDSTCTKSLMIRSFHVSCRKMALDSLMSLSAPIKVPYKYNSISISFCYPDYSQTVYRIRYRIGRHPNGIWNDLPSQNVFRENDLRPGNYVIEAEAYDSVRTLSSLRFCFEVCRPWYLKSIFIILFALLSITFIILIIWLFLQVAIKRKEREWLVQDAYSQVEQALKSRDILSVDKEMLEKDLIDKSKELSTEVLYNSSLRQSISALREDIQRLYLDGKINKSNRDILMSHVVNSIESDEENWLRFQIHFDRIHEGFLSSLKREYPSLTSTDMRFCAMLKLNQSTKEIAQQLNISTRGVDAARYRIRKKLGLAPEESLTGFIINFKGRSTLK